MATNRFSQGLTCLFAVCFIAQLPAQQLDSSWTITVNGQTSTGANDGTFRVSNVSVGDFFPTDGIGDDWLRMLAFRDVGGELEYAFSERFQIRVRNVYEVQSVTFTNSPPPSVAFLRVSPASPVLSAAQLTTTLSTTALLNDGSFRDVTPASEWTNYRTSNAAVVVVSVDGQVTARGPGEAIVTASNDGASAVTRITVVDADPMTEVRGFALDATGAPVNGATIDIPQFSLRTQTAVDGSFSFADVPTRAGDFDVLGRATTSSGVALFGSSARIRPAEFGGFTDAGVVILRELPCGFDPILGSPLQLGDDQVVRVRVTSFPLRFFGETYETMWIGSNGTVQFGPVGNPAVPAQTALAVATTRGVSIWHADLDPSAGGRVYLRVGPMGLVVTWFEVPEFGTASENTMQFHLLADGSFSCVYANVQAVTSGVRPSYCGVSSGMTSAVQIGDLSGGGLNVGSTEALFEAFGNGVSSFDLDGSCLAWRPNAIGGYDVSIVEDPIDSFAVPAMYGRVHGAVRDASGRPIPSARVRVSSNGELLRQLTADLFGNFAVRDLQVPSNLRFEAIDAHGALLGAGGATLGCSWSTEAVRIAPIVGGVK